jgi:hypothetical protein
MKKLLLMLAIVALLYLFNAYRNDSNAYNCARSASPDGQYVAEECTLHWNRGDHSEFVGRLYDSSGKLLARRTLYAPEPEILWVGTHVMFTGGGEKTDMIALPPPLSDRINAALWRISR